MAITAASIWEIRTTGSDSNGGCYDSSFSGTDYSQQDSAQLSVSDAVTNGTTTVTSATGGFTSAMKGNGVNIAGTVYQITAVGSSISITIDRSSSAASGQTLKVGGACGSPGYVAGQSASKNVRYIKAGTYSITTSSANVSNGVVNDTVGGADSANLGWWIGYSTTRTKNNTDTPPLLQLSSVSSVTIFKTNVLSTIVYNISVDGASGASTIGFDNSASFGGNRNFRCKALNCTYGFSSSGGPAFFLLCETSNCSSQGFNISATSYMVDCTAHGGAAGFVTSNSIAVNCIAYANSGAGFSEVSSGAATWINCSSYGNTGNGFYVNDGFGRSITAINCLAVGNSAYGFNFSNSADNFILQNCAGYNNTSGNVNTNITANYGFITLSGDPFTNAASGDFSLNNTSGAGASCRAAGIPGLFPAGLTTGYLDIGAVQHQDSGGGGSTQKAYTF